ncbi:MAG TPA: phenylacetate--CoA ligase [Methanothrix sp.]|jgi:phenylacetate-CoA ligase|nr:phenylacetate--CoA ligase [Methanothrix sp.]OPX79582.1 MAG: long-chain-fatty-acid--CoA ligase [Methanosaeta sp. PtaB.Bin087]OPY52367.1 MAG: long-chain-fatty-acid--CoA ligase [Methanosaeta sp. PtaU1.Bin055]HPY72440.1 phenylacetate--CoA ligase [Methanothrix sp.]HQA62224.1 phenylacetate--CoA ligase [Methanothrix sp.]
MNFWQPKIETMKRSDLEDLQLRRLKDAVKRAYDRVPFYHRRMRDLGVTPSDVTSLADVRTLPETRKGDLRDNYPFGLFAVPKGEVVRVHASSGTTGKPTVVGYTARDIETWSDMVARDLVMVGCTKEDIFQNAVNYGFFTGGLGIHYGIERMGAMAVPSGTGSTRRQIEIMIDFGVTALHCTPSYALYLAETVIDMGLVDDLSLKVGCFGAEPWSDRARTELEEMLNIKAYDSYGLSEMFGPGVAFECQEQNGLHIWEDHFLVEVVDPDGLPCAPGERGELVLTSLTKEAMPLIRYHTGDVTFMMEEECPCGRTSAKLHRFLGRADDMLVVRGINVFPSQIEDVLLKIPEIGDYFQVVVDRKRHGLDEISIKVEMSDLAFTGELADLARLQKKVEDELKSVMKIRSKIELVEKGSLPRTEGKSKKIVDLRDL